VHEPGCAIEAAVERGEVDAGRFDSYRRMMRGEDDE
jgi:putative ribosome biogenesis GTPase RsgA